MSAPEQDKWQKKVRLKMAHTLTILTELEAKMAKRRRSEAAKKAAAARWGKKKTA